MEESFLFLLLSYALTSTLSQRERARLPAKSCTPRRRWALSARSKCVVECAGLIDQAREPL